MIHVLATITTKALQRDAVLRHFQAYRQNVLSEAGCIEYSAAVDSEPPLGMQSPLGADTFVVIEKWESVEALQAHSNAPHMTVYREQVRDLIASRSILVLSPAS